MFEWFELLKVQSVAAATRGWQVRTLPGGKSIMEIIASVNTILLWSASLIAEHVCTSIFRTLTTCINKVWSQTSELWLKTTYGTNSRCGSALYMWIICLLPWPTRLRIQPPYVCSPQRKPKHLGAYGLCWVLTTCICIGCQLAKSSIVRYGILPVLTLRATLTKSISHEPNQFANIDRTPRIHGPNMQSSNSKHVHLSKVQAGLLFSPIWQLSKMMYKVSLRSLYSTFI